MANKLRARPVEDLINRQCFISYSWDSTHHKDWVRELANKLQLNGVSTSLDQWDVTAGMDVPNYVETRIRESEFVLLVCTPSFAKKADSNRGGVGYEKTIITGQIFQGIGSDKKLIPLLRSGTPKRSLPSYLKSKAFVDFSKDSEFDRAFDELLRSILSAPRYIRPKLGTIPSLRPIKVSTRVERSRKTPPSRTITTETHQKASTNKPFKPSPNKPDYASSVFLNCPVTESYAALFRAIVFTIMLAGFRPRSPLEIETGTRRIEKLFTIISGCKYGIHDISQRLERDPALVRLNPAFELGIFMGAQRFESKRVRNLLVLNSHLYLHQKMLSDLSGRDLASHNNKVSDVIKIVRDWLRSVSLKSLPSGALIHSEYQRFSRNLPKICSASNLSVEHITFNDFAYIVASYLKARANSMNEGK